MKTKRVYTVLEAKKRMERYCSYQERCHQEVERKLNEMNLIIEARELIILHLLEHDFLNEERFSKTYARGKFNIKKWGKQRIVREFKFRNITEYNIKSGLQEIDEGDYYKTFNELAQKKCLNIKEANIYKKRKKLADYLLYRGWESTLVYNKVIELIPN
ncbi:MAG: RecX family transcriptional regulator [Flavobacteriaceae bacterium]|nr:RecX family transcriptional regulator [Flavobacteriaceae bacterium]